MPASTRLLFAASAIALACLPAAAGAAPPHTPRAITASGVVEGALESTGVASYKGIPYAAAPVGDLRWKAPQPLQSWRGVRPATRFGPRPMQLPLFADMVFRSDTASEDCLYLNVWTPSTRASQRKLPVLVYFYGGGFAAGDSSEPRYDGAAMAAKGIVTVTVNYRLNVFGFLAHPELTAESPHQASGNYGLMDQAAALQWVNRNIAAFGGDPARVTIAGESAGSFSVSAQMISPLARGLVAGAIGESGSLLGLYAPQQLADGERAGAAFAAKIGAANLAALRALPARQLLEAIPATRTGFFVIEDGYVLPRSPASLYANGQQARVPLLAGWNSHEGSARQVLGENEPTVANFTAALQKLYGDQADSARQAYLGDGASADDVTTAAINLASDRFISYGTWNWIDVHARNSGKPVWRYLYARARPGNAGASHSAEIEYALGNLDGNKAYAWTPEDRALSQQMQGYFANFIKTGNPNGAGLPAWPQTRPGAGSPLMLLDIAPRAIAAPDDARFQFQDAVAGRKR